jgi:O-antigen ligase
MSDLVAPPRASAWEWTLTAVLALNLGWTTICLGGYRPETMVVTSTLTAFALAVAALAAWRKKSAGVHVAGWFILPFVLYAAANVMWVSPVRWLGWIDWFGWMQMLAVFWVVLSGIRSSAPRRVLFLTLVGLALVNVVLGCYQRFLHHEWLMLNRVQSEQFIHRASGSFGIPNSLAALLLLVLPAAGALTLRRHATAAERVAWGWVTSVLAFGLVLTISRGAWIGLALALTAWPLVVARGSWARRAALGGAALVAFLLGVAAIGAASPRVRERFVQLVHDAGERSRPIMWHAAWQLLRERPVLGTGAASYNVRFEKYRPEGFNNEPQWAHNDYLNTLSDYGALGFALFFGGAGLVVWRAVRSRPTVARGPPLDWLDAPAPRAALVVGLGAFALQLFVDFHFKIPALAMAFAVVSALVVSGRWPAFATAPLARVGFGLAALVAVGFVAAFVVPLFRAEALRYRARQSVDQLALAQPAADAFRSRLAEARSDAERAVVIQPADGQAWAELSYTTALSGRVDLTHQAELGRGAEDAATKALALSEICPEFWIRRGVARDMQGKWLDAGNDFAKAVALAPQSAVAWYYNADHLARNPNEIPLALASLQLCLRLDPSNPDGLALRQRLAIGRSTP